VTPLPRRLQALGAFMSFKNSWQRDKLRKRINKGFRGYPAATISCYGPTDQRASKLVAAIIQYEGAEPEPMKKWDSESLDVRTDPEIGADVLRFLESNGAKSKSIPSSCGQPMMRSVMTTLLAPCDSRN
jgi:hypothetical protein